MWAAVKSNLSNVLHLQHKIQCSLSSTKKVPILNLKLAYIPNKLGTKLYRPTTTPQLTNHNFCLQIKVWLVTSCCGITVQKKPGFIKDWCFSQWCVQLQPSTDLLWNLSRFCVRCFVACHWCLPFNFSFLFLKWCSTEQQAWLVPELSV